MNLTQIGMRNDVDLQAWAAEEVAAYRERQLQAKIEALDRDIDRLLIRKARFYGRLEGALWVALPALVAWGLLAVLS